MSPAAPISLRVSALLERLRQGGPPDAGCPAAPGPPPRGEWCEPFHEAWMAHEQDDPRIRLAHAQAAELSAARPLIASGEIIIGGDTLRPIVSGRESPFGNHIKLDLPRAEALETDRPDLAAPIRSLRDYWLAWLAANNPGYGLTCHASLAWERALEPGIDGLRAWVAGWRSRAESSGEPNLPWYDALLITVDGLAGFICAHARAADAAAETEADPIRRAELQAIAGRCHHITGQPPRTFAEAIQLFYLLFLACGHDSPGPLDRYLWPAMNREISEGTLGPAEAQELVDCLCLKMAGRTAYGATLGGQRSDGTDAVNPLSFMFVEAHRRLRLLSPRTTVRWHPGISPAFMAAACQAVAEGPSYPAFVNDTAVIHAATARGMALEHAREYTFVGCGQVYPHGRGHGSYEDVILNAARPLELALHNGCDPQTGEREGPATGDPAEMAAFGELLAACRIQLQAMLQHEIGEVNSRRSAAAGKVWDLLRSLLTHSCVQRGLDWHEGGAEYSEGMVDVVGLTTLLDSLLAIRAAVYELRLFTLPELVAILDSDWEGHEDLRRYCLQRLPKFGNDDPDADDFVRAQAAWVNDAIMEHRTAFGGPWGMDIIGWSGAVMLGEETGATPDGRRRGDPLADCAGPAQGRNTHGLTATLHSALCLPHGRAHGPMALSLRFPPEAVRGECGVESLQAVIETYFHGGGQQLQISIAGTEEMKAAMENPEAHRSLMVRVGGFSAYFTELDRRWQLDLIARTEMAC